MGGQTVGQLFVDDGRAVGLLVHLHDLRDFLHLAPHLHHAFLSRVVHLLSIHELVYLDSNSV